MCALTENLTNKQQERLDELREKYPIHVYARGSNNLYARERGKDEPYSIRPMSEFGVTGIVVDTLNRFGI